MDSKIGFEINVIVVEAIRGRCTSLTVLTATVSEIFGGQTTPSILLVYIGYVSGPQREWIQPTRNAFRRMRTHIVTFPARLP